MAKGKGAARLEAIITRLYRADLVELGAVEAILNLDAESAQAPKPASQKKA